MRIRKNLISPQLSNENNWVNNFFSITFWHNWSSVYWIVNSVFISITIDCGALTHTFYFLFEQLFVYQKMFILLHVILHRQIKITYSANLSIQTLLQFSNIIFISTSPKTTTKLLLEFVSVFPLFLVRWLSSLPKY